MFCSSSPSCSCFFYPLSCYCLVLILLLLVLVLLVTLLLILVHLFLLLLFLLVLVVDVSFFLSLFLLFMFFFSLLLFIFFSTSSSSSFFLFLLLLPFSFFFLLLSSPSIPFSLYSAFCSKTEHFTFPSNLCYMLYSIIFKFQSLTFTSLPVFSRSPLFSRRYISTFYRSDETGDKFIRIIFPNPFVHTTRDNDAMIFHNLVSAYF